MQKMNQDQVQNMGDKCEELEYILDHLCVGYLIAQRRSFGILCHLIQMAIKHAGALQSRQFGAEPPARKSQGNLPRSGGCSVREDIREQTSARLRPAPACLRQALYDCLGGFSGPCLYGLEPRAFDWLSLWHACRGGRGERASRRIGCRRVSSSRRHSFSSRAVLQ